jgi:hypothetical protein
VSMFRKTALTSFVIGAGLVSTAGAAFAGDAPCEGHGHSSSESSTGCSNAFGGSVDNGGAKQLGAVNGSQGALQGNLCDIANGNSVLSGNHISVLSIDESEIPASGPDSGSTSDAGARTTAAPATAPAAAPKQAPAAPTTETVPIR